VSGEASPAPGARRGRAGLPHGLGIGASTGGPRALLALLAKLDIPSGTYIFLVQHIHPKFTHLLTRRLGEVATLPVVEAEGDAQARPGQIYVAPSGRHLLVEYRWPSTYRTQFDEGPLRNGVRPSVDALFTSLAKAFGNRAVGVVLTGMGRDGLEGARAIKESGGVVLAEAESTCTVYGMPRALAEAGLADRMVPIGEMAAAIREACGEPVVDAPGCPTPMAG
jgi:two-component system, chemotaxis family, protein-glutamate methylesterase/glutaminase